MMHSEALVIGSAPRGKLRRLRWFFSLPLMLLAVTACASSTKTVTPSSTAAIISAPTAMPSLQPMRTPTPIEPSPTETSQAIPGPTQTPVPNPTSTSTIDVTPTRSSAGSMEVRHAPIGDIQLLFRRANNSLWAVSLDDKELWPLTEPLTGQMDAVLWSLSPDSRWVAVVQSVGCRTDEAEGTLSLLDLTTGERHIVLDSLLPPDRGWKELPDDADRAALWENVPAWSPDGTEIAFVSAHQGQADLYVYSLTGGEIRRLTDDELNAAWPTWAPDGKRLVYHGVRYFGTGAGPNDTGLWVVSSDAEGPPRRLSPDDRYEEIEVWLDDEQALTLSRHTAIGYYDLTLVNVSTGGRTMLFEDPVAHPAWSKKANLIAISSGQQPTTGLYLMDPGDPEPTPVSEGPLWGAHWLPDENHLVYVKGSAGPLDDREGTCYCYDLASGNSQQRPREWCRGQWSPDGHLLLVADEEGLDLVEVDTGTRCSLFEGEARHASWSLDSRWVIWLEKKEERRYHLWAARADGGEAFRVATDVGYWPEPVWVEK